MKFTGILGVIVITILVIIIASLTYIRVESLREEQMRIANQHVEGMVSVVNKTGSINYNEQTFDVWSITLTNGSASNSYQMIFDETYPPQTGLNLQFYYDVINQDDTEYYLIKLIKDQ